jgi:5S rRNA maturation endonuclease (ribonuclease M5)
MLIKFLGRGKGSGKAAMDYLFDERNHVGKERFCEPEILRGNPSITAKLIYSLEYKNKYSSAVIAWHPADKPTDYQINEALDGFVKVAFAGLGDDQFDYCAVLHREERSEHIHIIVPRVELSTGKAFNPAPPGWKYLFDPLRDYLNEKNGWNSPDISKNPDAARLIQPGMDGVFKNGRAAVKKDIEEYLVNQVMAGVIRDRNDIVESLKTLDFEINRAGKDYITVKYGEQKFRLKGAMFNEGWRLTNEVATENSRARIDDGGRKLRADQAYEELEMRIESRAAYNAKRYPCHQPTVDGVVKQQLTRKSESNQKPSSRNKVRLDKAIVDHDYFDSINVGADVIHGSGNPISNSSNQRERENASKIGSDGWKIEFESVWKEGLRTDRPDPAGIREWLQGGEINDGIREKTIRAGQGHGRAAHEGNISVGRASSALGEASQGLERAIRKHSDIIRNGVQRMIKNSKDELDYFKRHVNLVEFAAYCGYQLVKSKSSKAFKTMSKGKGQPSIVIYTGASGDGLYFERGVDRVGTVVDMFQREIDQNLGKVRMFFREWTGYAAVQNLTDYQKPKVVEKDLVKVRMEVSRMAKAEANHHYLRSRYLHEKTLSDPRFFILKDKPHGNAIFVHYDEDGEITGYEKRNPGINHFAGGGIKGAWLTTNIRDAKKVVICESAIDALSHSQMSNSSNDTAYVSVAGEVSDAQLRVIEKFCQGKDVLIATDNDDAGHKHADKIKGVLSGVANTVERDLPKAKDWNDDLKAIVEKWQHHRGFDLDLR